MNTLLLFFVSVAFLTLAYILEMLARQVKTSQSTLGITFQRLGKATLVLMAGFALYGLACVFGTLVTKWFP